MDVSTTWQFTMFGKRECIVEQLLDDGLLERQKIKPYFMRYFVRDRFGSKCLMLWLDFILILFSQLRILARGLIISGRFVQVRTTPKHRSTHISNYQSTKRKSIQHDESDQMKFSCALKNVLPININCSGLSIATKGLG